jgi:hypothetical protein
LNPTSAHFRIDAADIKIDIRTRFDRVDQRMDHFESKLDAKFDALAAKVDKLNDGIATGVRGKYLERYREGVRVVTIDPDLTDAFPNAKAVNDGLRELLSRRRQERG